MLNFPLVCYSSIPYFLPIKLKILAHYAQDLVENILKEKSYSPTVT